MPLSHEMFPELSGRKTFIEEGSSNAAKILGAAVRAVVAPGSKISERLNRRDETGAPIGPVAFLKDMLVLRALKICSRPYRRLRYA